MTSGEEKHWYAVRVRSNHEHVVASMLDAVGVEAFLPCFSSKRRWSDRVKQIEEPLFQGYVFGHFHGWNPLPVLQVPGVVQVVSFGKLPASIPDEEIAALKKVVEAGISPKPSTVPKTGEPVVILQGPLKGVEGVLLKAEEKARFVVSVTILQRAVSVEMKEEWVAAAA